MTTRILPPAEYGRLAGTELAGVTLPASAVVLVVEDGDTIVACWSATLIVHVEGLWVHPAHKSAAIRLWRGMQRMVTERFSASAAATSSCSDVVADFLTRVGASPVPGQLWMVPMKGRS